MVNFGVHHLPLPGGAPAPKMMGSLPPLPPPPGAAPRRAVRGGGHAMPAPHGGLPRRTRAFRANPRPMRVSGKSLDHNGEGCAL